MNRRQRIHEEVRTEENCCRDIRTNEILESTPNNTTDIRNIAENLHTTTMETQMKVVVRRTFLTPSGRKFPPRKPVTFDLLLPFPAKSGEQTTGKGFQTIQERVKAEFPKLQEEFTILRKGDDGELVPCNNQEELLKAIDEAEEDTMQLFVQGPCKWQNKAEDVQVQCNNCSTNFQGMRTRCLECSDFDLCPQCDEKGVHGSHVMVRCDRPRFFNYALPLFKEILPKLCREVREKTPGDTMPRLGPKDVRQVWQKERKLRDEKMESDEETGAERKTINRPRPGNKKQVCERRQQDVQCSNCTDTIRGMRVKCLECDDMNLCNQCDEQGVHGNHVMVKCDRPRFFSYALPMFVDVFPKLCDEVKGKAQDGTIPRMEPNEVRQFWKKERNQKENRASEANKCDRSQHGVTCNNCEVRIQGMRLKCLECGDFNLCVMCDGQGVHAEHVMIKSDKPRFFNFGLRHFDEILPKLIEEHKKNDAQIPRLERQDVRQFWQKNRTVEQKKCEGRRQHMRKMWHMFLQDIAASEELSGDDWEILPADGGTGSKADQSSSDDEVLASEVQNMELREKADKAGMKHQIGDKVQQMKRQWMQKCLQEWRQKMQTERESQQPNRKLAFKIWRPYMKGCWDSWNNQMADSEMDTSAQDAGSHQKPHHSRRRWIQKSWKLWCQEANKAEKECRPSDPKCPDDADEQPMKRGAFPGFHSLMKDSWKMMQEEAGCQKITKCDNTSDSDLADEGDFEDFNPKRAQQFLKKCWIDGCRELWWMQTKKLVDLAEVDSEDKSGEESGALNQNELMEMMSAKPNWRSYMQQIWRLWKQLSKQAGMCDAHNASTAGTATKGIDGEGTSTPDHPRRKWIESCWPLWNDEMKKCAGSAESAGSGATKPMWYKRPFVGWRPLVIRSWQMMKADEDYKEAEGQETRFATVRSMRAAWVKEVQKDMKKLQLEQGYDCPHDPVPSDEETGATRNIQPNPQWEKQTQMQRKLMQQYWQMCKNSTEKAKRGPNRYPGASRKQRKFGGMLDTACADYSGQDDDAKPRLRLKLQMKKNQSAPK